MTVVDYSQRSTRVPRIVVEVRNVTVPTPCTHIGQFIDVFLSLCMEIDPTVRFHFVDSHVVHAPESTHDDLRFAMQRALARAERLAT